MGNTMKMLSEKIIEASAESLRAAFADRRDLQADRQRGVFLVRYLAHADGYVMARRPGCRPFVLTETEWRGLRKYPAADVT